MAGTENQVVKRGKPWEIPSENFKYCTCAAFAPAWRCCITCFGYQAVIAAVFDHRPIELLQHVAARLSAGELGEDGRQFAQGLLDYLAGASSGLSLEEALGLKVDAGGVPWWNAAARSRRDRLLYELATRFCGSAAATLGAEVRRYERSTWQRTDRGLADMPPSYRGTPRELLFAAFRENESFALGRMPSSTSQLRRIIATHSSEKESCARGIPPLHARADVLSCESGNGKQNADEQNHPKAIERRRRRSGA
jgi:hypothetical protein